MSVTLRWLLEGSSLEGLHCVACPEQLDASINSVNVLDNLDVVKWIKPHELVLSSGYLFMNDEAIQRQLIRDLRQVNCAALCVKSRRFFQKIPDAMIQEAAQVGLPLIELPFFYSFSDISRVVYERLFYQRTFKSRRELKLLSSLTGPLFAGGSLNDMLLCIVQQYRTPAMLLKRDGVCISVVNFNGSALSPPDRFPRFSMPSAGETVLLPMGGRQYLFLCVPLQGGYGGLFLLENPESSLRTELSVLQHAASLVSLKLEQRRLERSSVDWHRHGFMELLTGNIREMTREEIQHFCENYQFDYQKKRICMTLIPRKECTEREMDVLVAQLTRAAECLKEETEEVTPFLCCDRQHVCIFLLASPDFSNPELVQLAKKLLGVFAREAGEAAFQQILAGVGCCHRSLESIPMSLRECRDTISLMTKIFPERNVFIAAPNSVYRVLSQMPAEELRRIYLDTVAVLWQFDQANRTDLLQTLNVFYACHFNALQAAKELYIHRNTMLHRLEKIKELLRCDLQDMDETMTVYLGLCVFKMLN